MKEKHRYKTYVSTRKFKLPIFVVLIFLLTLTSVSLVVAIRNDELAVSRVSYRIKYIKEDAETSNDPVYQEAIVDKLNDIKNEQKQQIVQEERQAKIDRIEALFTAYGSPMSGYGELIYNKAEECGGGDYRIIVGIAGNESGFGKVPLKSYNPFGYLDNVQYSGWEDSISNIACAITQRFLVPCNNDLYCVIRTYGGPDTPKDLWVRNVTYFMNQL